MSSLNNIAVLNSNFNSNSFTPNVNSFNPATFKTSYTNDYQLSKDYTDLKIQQITGIASSSFDTLGEIQGFIETNQTNINTVNTNINTIESEITNINNEISTINTEITTINTEITNLGATNSTVDPSVLSQYVLSSDLTTELTNYTLTTDLTTQLNNYTLTTDLTTQLATKLNVSDGVDLTSNQTITGIKTIPNLISTTQPSTDNSTNIATTEFVKTQINDLIAGAPTTLDNLNEIATVLQANSNNINDLLSNTCSLTTVQTILGDKTFQGNVYVNNQTQGDNSTKSANTSYVDTGLTNLNSAITSTYQPISSMSNYVLTSSLSSYPNVSNINTWTNNNFFNATTYLSKQAELYGSGGGIVGTGNVINIGYNATNSIWSITPTSSSNNITLNITNIPTDQTYAIYDFCYIILVGTYKRYIQYLSVNGTSITMLANGGFSNTSANFDQGATVLIQNIYIQMNNTTVINAFTNLSYYY